MVVAAVVAALMAVADVKVEATAEDAKVVSEKAMAAVTDVRVETAVVVSEIFLEEAVKTEVEVADVKAEATENAGPNHKINNKKPFGSSEGLFVVHKFDPIS